MDFSRKRKGWVREVWTLVERGKDGYVRYGLSRKRKGWVREVWTK